MTDKMLPADFENDRAIADLIRCRQKCRHQIIESDAHRAAFRIPIGMVMRRQMVEQDSRVVRLDQILGLRLALMTHEDARCGDMMGMRRRCASQNAKSAPVENEGDREKATNKTAQDTMHESCIACD